MKMAKSYGGNQKDRIYVFENEHGVSTDRWGKPNLWLLVGLSKRNLRLVRSWYRSSQEWGKSLYTVRQSALGHTGEGSSKSLKFRKATDEELAAAGWTKPSPVRGDR